MMVARGWLFPLLTLLLAAVYTTNSQDIVGNVTDSRVSRNSTSLPKTLPINGTTAAPVTGSTEDPEKPITEQIRTYIEDSVKSVKSAISKIGKFVGEFFDQDAPSNTTVPANSSASSTPIPITAGAAASTLPPSTPAPN